MWHGSYHLATNLKYIQPERNNTQDTTSSDTNSKLSFSTKTIWQNPSVVSTRRSWRDASKAFVLILSGCIVVSPPLVPTGWVSNLTCCTKILRSVLLQTSAQVRDVRTDITINIDINSIVCRVTAVMVKLKLFTCVSTAAVLVVPNTALRPWACQP